MVTNELLMKPVIREVEKRIQKSKDREVSEREIEHLFDTEQARVYRRVDSLGNAVHIQLRNLAWI